MVTTGSHLNWKKKVGTLPLVQIFTCIGANHIARRRVSASALVAHCGQGFKKCDVLAGLKVGQRQEDHGRSAWNKENKNGNKRLAWQSLCRCLAAVTSSTFFNYFSVSSFFCSLLLTAPTCHRTRPFHQSRNTHCFQPKWLVETGWSLPEHLIPTEKWTKAAMQYDAKKCHEIASRTSKGGRSAKRKIYLPDLPMDSSSISPSILAVGRFFQILPDSSRFFQILPVFH